jgi:uncharacterized protein
MNPNSSRITFREFPKVCVKKVNTALNNGVFSTRPLARGERVFFARGKKIALHVQTEAQSALYPNAIGISPRRWLDPYKNNPLNFLNHSCEPNLGIQGARTFVALKDIGPDEHLTVDYGITEMDPLWSLEKCKCGSPKCRKVIRSVQYLPKRAYQSYLPFIPTLFQRIYSKKVHV